MDSTSKGGVRDGNDHFLKASLEGRKGSRRGNRGVKREPTKLEESGESQ